jgi:DNA-binding transcriptional regulator LsrR (DeoR family)
MPAVNKHFDAGARRAAIELCRAKVPQRTIMKQLGMSKATLMRVLAFARATHLTPLPSGRRAVVIQPS